MDIPSTTSVPGRPAWVLPTLALAALLAACAPAGQTGDADPLVLVSGGDPAAVDAGDDVAHARHGEDDEHPGDGAHGALRIGSVNGDPFGEVEVFQPFVDHLAAQLGDDGVTHGEVVVTSSASDMAAAMADGEVDLYIDSPFPAFGVADDIGGVPLARRWKKGVREYTAVVFTRADSPVQTLDDLHGRVFAAEEPDSTSGFLLPLTLIGDGRTVVPLRGPDTPVAPGTVGYVFSGDDDNTVLWVVDGTVDAGLTSRPDYEEIAAGRDDLRVVAETQPVPRHVVVAGPHVDARLRTAIVDVLLAMEHDDVGSAVLQAFERTTRFEALADDDVVEIRRLIGLLDVPVVS